MNQPIPIFLINGFLESGKTSFIKPLFEDPEFTKDNKTLLIVCEEGLEEYDEKILTSRNTSLINVEEEEFSMDFLKKCAQKFQPTQIMIEWNGMWPLEEIITNLPQEMQLYQIITMVDAGTFENYAANMGSIMMEKLLNTDMIIFNRCTDSLKERLAKRNLKMLNRSAEIYLEFTDGRSEVYDSGVPPFDMTKPVLDLPDEEYGVWYVDVMDHPERYEGKKIKFKGIIARDPKFPKGVFAVGRQAMVCCAQDITFLAVICKGLAYNYLKNKDWVEITGTIKKEYNPLYEGEGPVFYPENAQICLPPKNELVGF